MGQQGSNEMTAFASGIGINPRTLHHFFGPLIPVHFSVNRTPAEILGDCRRRSGIDMRNKHSQKVGSEAHRFLIQSGVIHSAEIEQTTELTYDCTSVDTTIDPKQCTNRPG